MSVIRVFFRFKEDTVTKKFVIVYTVEILKNVASAYNSRFEFAKAKCGAYRSACRMGVVDEVCAHMPKNVRKKRYSDEYIAEKLSVYASINELRKSNIGLYKLAWLRWGLQQLRDFYLTKGFCEQTN